MMKQLRQTMRLLTVLTLPWLGSCSTVDEPGVETPSSAAPYGQPLTSVNGQGSVTIMEGNETVAVCQTALPNIEQTRFINEQNQIVVKSRGNHGPATVELFDSKSGGLQKSVKAYEISANSPAWTRGMGD